MASAPIDRAAGGAVIYPDRFPPAAAAHIAGKLLNRHSAHEIYLAVLEGLIRRDLIEQRAPQFRSKAFAFNGQDYGRHSLDDDLRGWSLIDRLGDPDALARFDRISF